MEYEGPQHQVTVSSFYMSKYELTQKEYQEVMGRVIFVKTGDNLPVECNWYDAIEYCNKRSIKEGLTPCYRGSGDNIICDWNANGYRLPTEAEWEYAAKGGNKDYLIYLYSGSNNPEPVAWYAKHYKDYNAEIHPVGQKAPNSLGIYDMSGNLSEWCWDWYGNYTSRAQANPHGPDISDALLAFAAEYPCRINRGGGYGNSIRGIRSSRRGFDHPGWYTHGFRVVRR
jgi:formylglycine-generating enzyme required for sulfatase activity